MRFEAVTVMTVVTWDVMYSHVNGYEHYRETGYFHFHGRRLNSFASH